MEIFLKDRIDLREQLNTIETTTLGLIWKSPLKQHKSLYKKNTVYNL